MENRFRVPNDCAPPSPSPSPYDGDWGEVRVVPIEDGREFWYLWDALCGDASGGASGDASGGASAFRYWREEIVEAFRGGRMHGLRVAETDAMYARRAFADPIFNFTNRRAPMYLLPCFCTVDQAEPRRATMLWVHGGARRLGLSARFVRGLGIQQA